MSNTKLSEYQPQDKIFVRESHPFNHAGESSVERIILQNLASIKVECKGGILSL